VHDEGAAAAGECRRRGWLGGLGVHTVRAAVMAAQVVAAEVGGGGGGGWAGCVCLRELQRQLSVWGGMKGGTRAHLEELGHHVRQQLGRVQLGTIPWSRTMFCNADRFLVFVNSVLFASWLCMTHHGQAELAAPAWHAAGLCA
jgi:hypothetical protein